MEHSEPLLQYTVRVSRRAKYVNLQITLHKGLEVIVPQGFDLRHLPAIIRGKRRWIERTAQRLHAQRELLNASCPGPVPRHIHLRAIDEEWNVVYRPGTFSGRSAYAGFDRTWNRQLTVARAEEDVAACKHALREWLKERARRELVPIIRRLSQRLDLPYARTSVRGQTTIWGSCSARRNISLNFKLLFLPRDLVRYVCIHELCHTRHLNHSRRFWDLVGRLMPEYEEMEQNLRDAWRYVPLWVDD